GRLSFTKEPRTYRTLNHNAICNLNITLPAYSKESDSDQDADDESEKSDKKLDWQDDADRKEETLAIIADLLGFSWAELARELEFSEDDIQSVRTENPNSLQEQSHALLQRWVEREGKHATEDCLIKRLTKINRMDIVHLIETQMNKSVQEQTSRTYAEIEKTLDHSEVSVALSSVQEDADSPRVVRRVESDRRPPPAVSEEDLSVASLLDIPSWAEPIGHTPSESMHGDLLEELEIPQPLTYADVVRGLGPAKPAEVLLSCQEWEPVWSASVSSDIECTDTTAEHWFRPPHIAHDVDLSGHRSFTPESTVSDWEGTDLCLETLFGETRPDSPQPLTYADVVRGLGPAKPAEVLLSCQEWEPVWSASVSSDIECTDTTAEHWFRPPHIAHDVDLSGHRSFTPESAVSDWEGTDFCLEILFGETRPDSPQPLTYADVVRGLGPAKPAEVLLSCQEWEPVWSASVSSDIECTDTTAEHWFRPPHIAHDVDLSGHRSFTPESAVSDWEGTDFCLEILFGETRPDSPQPLTYADVVRGLGPAKPAEVLLSCQEWEPVWSASVSSDIECTDTTAEHWFRPPHIAHDVDLSGHRSFTPESAVSDWEGTDFCLEILFGETRPDSPQPLTYADVVRGLGPAKPAEVLLSCQEWEPIWSASVSSDIECTDTTAEHWFRPPHIAHDVDLSGHRSFTPESTVSDWEGTDLCLEILFGETRPDSPQPLTYADVVRGLGPAKPAEVLLSCQEWEPVWSASVSSDIECTDTTAEHWFRPPHIAHDVDLSGHRSFTPESAVSDWEGTDFCLETLFGETRPDSPQPLTYADVVRGLGPAKPAEVLLSCQEWEPVWSASVSSDIECTDTTAEHWFRPPHIAHDVDLSGHRSFTPESTVSDWEGTDLCLETLFGETRPDSPQPLTYADVVRGLGPAKPAEVLLSCQEWEPVWSASVSSDIECTDTTAEHWFRPPHIAHDVDLSGHRSFTPESTVSDWEGTDLCLEILFGETRPDSPQPLTYADVVRGLGPAKPAEVLLSCQEWEPVWSASVSSDIECTDTTAEHWFRPPHIAHDVDLSGHRSFTPESTVSDWEGTDLCLEILFGETRPDSPQPLTYADVVRGLGPAKPAEVLLSCQEWEPVWSASVSSDIECTDTTAEHWFRPPHIAHDVDLSGHRSFTPESAVSDWEGTDFCLETLFGETRPDSPHFEDLIPYHSSGNIETSSDEDRPMTSGHYSEESLTPEDYDCFSSKSTSVKPKAEMTSSTSDEEYSIPPGYAETSSTHMPPGYAEVVHSGKDSPTFEYSDPEPFFDCKQAASDFSETEPDEPESKARSTESHQQDHLSHSRGPRLQDRVTRGVLLSSGSEDYEDAPFVHEPLHTVHEEREELLHYSEASDEEFLLCEASQLPPVCEIGAYDTDNTLTREITTELGPVSESSDDEFLTTRVVRRRVVIQVTRKIIRKCVSADGVEHQEVSLEGAPQGSISMAEGDGYSKVVKRTVVKSEGDHTEVTFTETEGFSASRQGTAEDHKVSCVERTVVEGQRTMTQQGDPSLSSDLPSAQDDFNQALGYISGFSKAELPHVVERETVKEDGTVVRRAHMRKVGTLRRTQAEGAGQRKQVLLERMDTPRRGSKPSDLQQHLHQLFHCYYKEDKEGNDEDEERRRRRRRRRKSRRMCKTPPET
ncbi:hypothetical protein INR49_030890, partial [Caranx melampygus]